MIRARILLVRYEAVEGLAPGRTVQQNRRVGDALDGHDGTHQAVRLARILGDGIIVSDAIAGSLIAGGRQQVQPALAEVLQRGQGCALDEPGIDPQVQGLEQTFDLPIVALAASVGGFADEVDAVIGRSTGRIDQRGGALLAGIEPAFAETPAQIPVGFERDDPGCGRDRLRLGDGRPDVVPDQSGGQAVTTKTAWGLPDKT